MEQPSAAHDRVSSSAESTLTLLTRARAGDRSALDILFTRYRPRLIRWAHRRLPAWARDLSETDDLVHDTLLKTFRNLDGFIPEHDRGFQHYLRLAIGNAVRDEIRKARTRPAITVLDPSHPSDAPSPLERALGQHRLADMKRLSNASPPKNARPSSRVWSSDSPTANSRMRSARALPTRPARSAIERSRACWP